MYKKEFRAWHKQDDKWEVFRHLGSGVSCIPLQPYYFKRAGWLYRTFTSFCYGWRWNCILNKERKCQDVR